MRQRKESEIQETLQVQLDELESKARERRIYDLTDFVRSEAFREAGYVLDQNRRCILRAFST